MFGIILQFTNYQLMLRVRIPLIRCVLDTTLCDKVCQWLAICGVLHKLWFPQLNHYDIAEILSKVTITLTLTNYQRFSVLFCCDLVFFVFDEYGHVGSVIMVVTSPVLGGRNYINKKAGPTW
jgi:hypothetical protein